MKEANIPPRLASARVPVRLEWRRPVHRSQQSTLESRQDATDDVGMSNTVSASVPLERGQPMTKQAETQNTGTVAVKRLEQLGVSSLEEHKTFHKASRWGYSRAVTRRGAGRERCRACTSTGACRKGPYQRQQGPPDMQTGQSVYACLRREVPADHEAQSQAQEGQLRDERRSHSRVVTTYTCFGGAAAKTPKRNEHVDHDRPALRRLERAGSCRVATWESRAGRTELGDQ